MYIYIHLHRHLESNNRGQHDDSTNCLSLLQGQVRFDANGSRVGLNAIYQLGKPNCAMCHDQSCASRTQIVYTSYKLHIHYVPVTDHVTLMYMWHVVTSLTMKLIGQIAGLADSILTRDLQCTVHRHISQRRFGMCHHVSYSSCMAH